MLDKIIKNFGYISKKDLKDLGYISKEELEAKSKKTEDKLKASEAMFDNLLDHIEGVSIQGYTSDGTVVYWNKSSEDIYGYNPEEAIGKNIGDLIITDEIQPMFKQVLELSKGWTKSGTFAPSGEVDLKNKDGSLVPVYSIHTAVCLPEKDPLLFCIDFDLTERKKVEAELSSMKNHLETLFNTAPIGIGTMYNDDTIKWCNDKGKKITGYPEGLMDKPAEMLYETKEEYNRVRRKISQQLKGGNDKAVVETTWKKENGETFPVRLSLSNQTEVAPKSDNNKSSKGYIVTFQDITEEIKLRQKVFEAQKMDSIGNLAGGVAHDFNNMLAGISGYAALLLLNEKDPINIEYLNGIQKATQRSGELTTKLLAFGRRGKNLVETINLNNVVDEVCNLLQRSMNKSIKIETDLEKELYSVDADPTQMNQIIMNLCINASEAMPESGTLNISTQNKTLDREFCNGNPELKSGEYIELIVQDNGCGMTQETINRIFEPFYTTKEDGDVKGTGLGLATVYGITQNHSGIIEVESELNQGTSFKVYLPKGKKELEIKETIAQKSNTGQGTILIIDDEEIVRNMARSMVEILGYTVILAKDGEEGVELYEKYNSSIDAIMLDMMMPNMDGKEAYLHIKEKNPNVKVVLTTGYARNEEAQKIMDLGVKKLLPKPYTIDKLSKTLEYLTSKK